MEHIRALPVPEEFKGFIFKFLFVHQFTSLFVVLCIIISCNVKLSVIFKLFEYLFWGPRHERTFLKWSLNYISSSSSCLTSATPTSHKQAWDQDVDHPCKHKCESKPNKWCRHAEGTFTNGCSCGWLKIACTEDSSPSNMLCPVANSPLGLQIFVLTFPNIFLAPVIFTLLLFQLPAFFRSISQLDQTPHFFHHGCNLLIPPPVGYISILAFLISISFFFSDVGGLDTPLTHTTLLDELFYWMMNYEFPQQIVTILLSMLPNEVYKVSFLNRS